MAANNGTPSIEDERGDVLQCPNCSAPLTEIDVAEHCDEEMQRLRESHDKLVRVTETDLSLAKRNAERTKRIIFQRVKKNRQKRLKLRSRRGPSQLLEYPCPICNVLYSQDEIQSHANYCLHKSSDVLKQSNVQSSYGDSEDEHYEEYEWAGQKRIRVSSLLQGGYSSIGLGQTITNQNEQDEDLNVDEDDTHIYGPPQYCESDIISTTHDQSSLAGEDVSNYMRQLVTSNTTTSTVALVNSLEDMLRPTCNKDADIVSTRTISESTYTCSQRRDDSCPKQPVNIYNKVPIPQQYQQIIDALKKKLIYFENHIPKKCKCLICLDDYRNPAISVSCWHVYCEECWLRSLGARKLCPQCNTITSPKDLRRIYI